MEGVPAGMEDWGIKGVFHEGGRLLTKHLRDFLPIILVFIFPAALIKVLHSQFFVADFGGPRGSSYFPHPTSFWLVFLFALVWALPRVLIITAFATMVQVLEDTIYTTDLRAVSHSRSLYTRVKSVYNAGQVDQTGGSSKRFNWEASNGKKLKSFSALLLCFMLWVVVSDSGMNFTPEAVAALGLPLWTVFLFTLLIVSITTVITSYFLVVGLVMSVWLFYPKAPILK